MTILARIIAWLGFWGCVLVGVVLFYEGVPILKNWPFNQIPYAGKIFEGEIERRIAAHDAKQELTVLVRRKEAESVLGEREAQRLQKHRQRIEQDAQQRVSLAEGQSEGRASFIERQAALLKATEDELLEISANFEKLKSTKPEVVKEYVERIKKVKIKNACPYPGDSAPSAGFLREYKRITE